MLNSTQSQTLCLADEFAEDYCHCRSKYIKLDWVDPECESCNTQDIRHRAAAELRRLYAVNKGMLEALKAFLEDGQDYTATRDKARAAIAKAVGEA
jgi:hypothetical protein